jgi:hypothetical protein
MTSLMMKPGGEIALPPEVCQRYGLTADTPLRVIQTRTGILLVPLTNAPMAEDLQRELAEWQSLSAEAWSMFGYEE